MIERITIRNFKSIAQVSVDLSPVTVLIGRSGVGKSCFLHALRFLRNFLLQGDAAINLEGGWPRIWPFGRPAPLSFSVRFLIPGYSKRFTYEISWTPAKLQSPEHVNAERFLLGDDVIFDRKGENWGKWPVAGAAPHGQSRIYLNSFPTSSEAVLAYAAWTSGIGCYDFPANVFSQNATGASPSPGNFNGLDDTASNYLMVIRDMTEDLRDQNSRRQIMARIKQINPAIESLELDSIIQPQHVVAAHKVGDQRMGLDLSQESDGLRRCYAHLLALYQTPPKQVLMFEEPEKGIHPGDLRNLAEEFKTAPSAGRGQILLTTQSPELLDGLAPEQLRIVELDENQLTKIGPLDPHQAQAVRDKLLEPGELLTMDPARPAVTAG